MTERVPQQTRGPSFESRVEATIRRLEEIGFARNLKTQDNVMDRDGNTRKVDLTFILCTWAVEILISVECKSRARPLSLDEVDQIKVLKRELPERNIFWLVSEGDINDNTSAALKSAGISFYIIDDLELTISDICESYKRSGIDWMREQTRMLSGMCPEAYGMSSASLKEMEVEVLQKLSDVHEMITSFGSYWSHRFSE